MRFEPQARPAFGTLARPFSTVKPVETTTTPYTGRTRARHQREARSAAEALPELPQDGESIHILMTGFYPLGTLITTTARRLPALTHLRMTSLCFNKQNVTDLVNLLEQRPGLRLDFLVSEYFHQHNKEVYAWTQEQFEPHGARLVSARCHAKVTTFTLTGEPGLVFESSANARSNRCTEILTAIRDDALCQWHSTWIDAMVNRAETKVKA